MVGSIKIVSALRRLTANDDPASTAVARTGCWYCVFMVIPAFFPWQLLFIVAKDRTVFCMRKWSAALDQHERRSGFRWQRTCSDALLLRHLPGHDTRRKNRHDATEQHLSWRLEGHGTFLEVGMASRMEICAQSDRVTCCVVRINPNHHLSEGVHQRNLEKTPGDVALPAKAVAQNSLFQKTARQVRGG